MVLVMVGNYSCMQIPIKPLSMGRLRIVGCGGNVPKSPGKIEIPENTRCKLSALSETMVSGMPKVEKILPNALVVVAVDAARTGKIYTNLVKASTQTKA